MASKSRTKKAGSKSGRSRASSDAFQQFDQEQITQFKQVFSFMDYDKDGFIGNEDLKIIHEELGEHPSDSEISDLLRAAPGQLNFTTFLQMFSDKLKGVDPEETILSAFYVYDKKNTGKIPEAELTKLLQDKSHGEEFSADEIKNFFKGKLPNEAGQLNYKRFAKWLTTGVTTV